QPSDRRGRHRCRAVPASAGARAQGGNAASRARVMKTPRILMCPPDYYGIEYEINPWMSRARGADVERTHRQWSALRDTLIRLGVQVELMTPERGLPDLVFTANAGLVY